MSELACGRSGPGAEALAHLPRGSRLLAGAHPPRAVFLDRDGVLVRDVHFLRRPEDIEILEGVPEALSVLGERFALVVVSNQSAIARGMITEPELAAIHARLIALLGERGAILDAIYACPHLPEGRVARFAAICDCRKPAPGMLLRAAREHALELSGSVMIGDAPRDVEAGARAGVRTILLGSEGGPGRLDEALSWID